MNIIFSKKDKGVSLDSLHKHTISPYKHWGVVLGVALAFLGLVIVSSILLFFYISDIDSKKSLEIPHFIEQDSLQKSVDFINSRTQK